jgi:aspartate-semialdehyde dehydrogenase
VTVKFKSPPAREQILERWKMHEVRGGQLPSAPAQIIHYLEEPDRPQPRLDVMRENGMAVSVGQLEIGDEGTIYFTALAHNVILGAAGGAVLATEAAIARQLIYRRV